MAASSFPRSFVLAAAAIGLLTRLAFGLGYWTNERLNRDEVEYLSLARNLAAGHGYGYDEYVKNGPVEPFGRAPGYPVFLALVGGGASYSEHVPAAVKVAQAVVGAIGVFLIGVAAYRMAGARPAMAAAAMAAVYPPLVWVSAYAYSEAVFWTLGLGVAILLSRTFEEPRGSSWKWALAAGAVVGVAILVRAATLLYVPLVGAWILWKRRWAAIPAFALGLVLVLTPWTIRNITHYGRFVLVASDGGVTFWTGNNSLATGEGDMAANPHLKLANQELRARHPGLNEEQMEPVYYQESFDWIRANPAAWIGLMFKKLFYLVVPIGPSYVQAHGARYYAASLISVGLLVPLAAIGLWRLRGRRERLAGMWLLALAAVATCLVFFPQERFRIPVLDPSLILCASGVWLPGRWAAERKSAERTAA
jgi:4-amino-4-deoxy-L-arabinose transferase-like glycosyltransferase